MSSLTSCAIPTPSLINKFAVAVFVEIFQPFSERPGVLRKTQNLRFGCRRWGLRIFLKGLTQTKYLVVLRAFTASGRTPTWRTDRHIYVSTSGASQPTPS